MYIYSRVLCDPGKLHTKKYAIIIQYNYYYTHVTFIQNIQIQKRVLFSIWSLYKCTFSFTRRNLIWHPWILHLACLCVYTLYSKSDYQNYYSSTMTIHIYTNIHINFPNLKVKRDLGFVYIMTRKLYLMSHIYISLQEM